MAAVNSNALSLSKANLLVYLAVASCLFFYYICTHIAIWNDCQGLQAQSSLSSSSVLIQLERLRVYFLNIFNSTDSHSSPHQSKSDKWNHHDIAELCDQNFLSISIFVMTSQFVYDINLFVFTLYDRISNLFKIISDFLKTVIIDFYIGQEKHEFFTSYFCVMVLLLLVVSCSYGAIIYFRKLKYSEKRFTSITPSCRDYSNSSLALTRPGRPVSYYGYREQWNGNGRNDEEKQVSTSTLCSWIVRWILLLIAFSVVLSIPWEFIRLYQKAVAQRAANVNMGLPKECSPDTLGWMESLKSVLRWHLSWSHDGNPCVEYYHATLVDPLWEVNPLLVLSSVLSRGVVHPLEVISAALGRSVRIFFAEIPAHWQPVVMLVAMVTLMASLLVLCSYRVSIPLLLRIEPKTPLGSPTETKSKCKETRRKTTKSRQTSNQSGRKKMIISNGNGSFSNSLQAG